MSARIEVKKVTASEDLKKAFSVRREVFVEEQHCPPELEWEHDDIAVHFLATYNDMPAGAARWRKTDKGYKLERFAVLQQYRGKKVGEALVAAVINDLPSGASPIYLNAQVAAAGFYSKLGFNKQGDEFEEAGIQHYKMVRILQ
ncbi:MAG: GNAT family N-acetyltransferase [Chitinophagaceae bacterium]|nr:GNAT family N-acetyltransferase [Chitinophagaceae bacterium]